MITGLVSWVIISTFHIGWITAKKKRGKFKLQYIQYTERILKESDQTVYHSVYWTDDNNYSLAAVRRENTSASNVFVFVCVLSSLPPARHTEAAFLLSGQHSYVVGLRRTCVLSMKFSWPSCSWPQFQKANQIKNFMNIKAKQCRSTKI